MGWEWGNCTANSSLMEAPLKTTDARREEEGGQGRVCLSLRGCVGQCPTVRLGAPSHVFARMASVQAAFWPWKTALQPRLHTHSLTQAATPHCAHCLHSHANTPPHLHIRVTALSHTCSSPPGPYTFTYVHTFHTPHSEKPGSHTPATYMHPHIHT